MQAFFGDGDEHIGAHRNPYLRLHRILARAQKSLDAQVLLDPLEEQLHLPALAIQLRDQLRLEREVVGQKCDAFVRLVLDHHAAQCGWIVLAGIEHRQHTRLIADDRRGGAIHRARVATLEPGVALGASDEEGLRLMDGKEPGEVQIDRAAHAA